MLFCLVIIIILKVIKNISQEKGENGYSIEHSQPSDIKETGIPLSVFTQRGCNLRSNSYKYHLP